VNGQLVNESRLRDGDELVIGNLRYQVRWEDEAMPAARAASPAAVSIDHLPSLDIPVPIKEPQQHQAMRPENGKMPGK
jgi:predicted component of type VI protein secretion system